MKGKDDSPLGRVLGGLRPRGRRRGRGASGLGSYDFDADNRVGNVPDIVGRPAPSTKMGRIFDGVTEGYIGDPETEQPPVSCPSWMNPDCLLLLSRFLEETFRNFPLNARPPSHIEPPFKALPIDIFPAAVNVVIPAGAPGAWTTVVTFLLSANRHRGEIHALGQSAESGAAFADLEWRVRIDGQPYDPYTSILMQLWQMVPPTPLCTPIHLRPDQTIDIQARSVAAGPHQVRARICGYFYPVRAEKGDEIGSTLVD